PPPPCLRTRQQVLTQTLFVSARGILLLLALPLWLYFGAQAIPLGFNASVILTLPLLLFFLHRKFALFSGWFSRSHIALLATSTLYLAPIGIFDSINRLTYPCW